MTAAIVDRLLIDCLKSVMNWEDAMPTPFETLGVSPNASAEQLRDAYHALVKLWHPDTISVPAEREQAQKKLTEINLAYEKAIQSAHSETIPDAKRVARSLMERGQSQAALRILNHAESRDAEWFFLQGQLLMLLHNPLAAHDSFRAAIRLDSTNQAYRQAALDAALASRKRATRFGRIRDWARRAMAPVLAWRIRL
jgi:tetratricopeptide (TPR) repeat protein